MTWFCIVLSCRKWSCMLDKLVSSIRVWKWVLHLLWLFPKQSISLKDYGTQEEKGNIQYGFLVKIYIFMLYNVSLSSWMKCHHLEVYRYLHLVRECCLCECTHVSLHVQSLFWEWKVLFTHVASSPFIYWCIPSLFVRGGSADWSVMSREGDFCTHPGRSDLSQAIASVTVFLVVLSAPRITKVPQEMFEKKAFTKQMDSYHNIYCPGIFS